MSKILNNSSLKELELLLGFLIFLENMGISEASSVADEVHYTIDEICPECEDLKSDCHCRCDYDRPIDEDRLYDAWRDQQIEDGNGY